MQSDEINFFLTIHTSILVVAIAAYYKYGDRSDILSKSHQGNSSSLKLLRTRLASDLAENLKPVFRNAPVIAIPTIGEDGQTTYIEKQTNYTESESFREAVRVFFESKHPLIKDYIVMCSASLGWTTWTKYLTRSIILLLIWELLSSGVFLFEKIFALGSPDWLLKGTVIVTAILGLFSVVACLPVIEFFHAKLIDIKRDHDSV